MKEPMKELNCEELKAKKEEFLKYEFFLKSWEAAVEHNEIWLGDWTDEQKTEFRKQIKDFVEKVMDDYKNKSPDEEVHIQNIEKLQEKCEKLNNKLNIGTCQKVLNMMCKYYWCAGWIEEPVHLPIDRINLSSIGKGDVSWTKIEKIDEYMEYISDFKAHTENETLAQWELKNWKRRNDR